MNINESNETLFWSLELMNLTLEKDQFAEYLCLHEGPNGRVVCELWLTTAVKQRWLWLAISMVTVRVIGRCGRSC